jgi:hypothetical protein
MQAIEKQRKTYLARLMRSRVGLSERKPAIQTPYKKGVSNMMQNAQAIRAQLITVIMAGVAGAGFAAAATAAAPGYVQAGGAVDAHLNAYISAHSNTRWTSGAARDADRAAEQMGANDRGLAASAAYEPEGGGTEAVLAKRSGTR